MATSSPLQPPLKRRRVIESSSALSRPFKSPLRTHVGSKQTDIKADNTTQDDVFRSPPSSAPDSSTAASSVKTPSISVGDAYNHQVAPRTTQPESPTRIQSLQTRYTSLLQSLTTLRSTLDTSNQALAIERRNDEADTTAKDAELDADLIALTAKWRAASRAAAEELYRVARDKVNKMGGVKALREREKEDRLRRREMDDAGGSSGWGWSEAGGERGADDGDGDIEGSEKREDAYGERGDYDEWMDGDIERESSEENDAEESYGLETMLKSLNVDLNVIGFDPDAQRWTD